MAVFQMLPKVIRAEKLLTLVALAELVNTRQVSNPGLPIRCRVVGKFHPTIAAYVRLTRQTSGGVLCMASVGIGRYGGTVVKGLKVVAI